MTTNALTRCPKCSNPNGRIEQFRHVEGGVCFLCNGAGEVTEAQASRWLASQLRRDMPRRPVVGVTTRSGTRTERTVDVAGLGLVRFVRTSGGLTAYVRVEGDALDHDRFSECPVWLTVTNGRVVIDQASNGVRYGMGVAHVQRCLQAALRA